MKKLIAIATIAIVAFVLLTQAGAAFENLANAAGDTGFVGASYTAGLEK